MAGSGVCGWGLILKSYIRFSVSGLNDRIISRINVSKEGDKYTNSTVITGCRGQLFTPSKREIFCYVCVCTHRWPRA